MTIRKVREESKALRAIILFVRRPELGKVKSRIAATEGPERALDIYKSLLRHTRHVLSELDADVFTFYSDDIDPEDLWTDIAKGKYLQPQGDLGQRIADAFKIILNHYRKVIIIGSDCAQLREHHIEEAFTKLENEDLVIGPSRDGGYYLLGCKALHPTIFDNIPWSTEEVLNQTIAAGDKIGLTMSQLETLSDIDYIEDWDTYGKDYLLVF